VTVRRISESTGAAYDRFNLRTNQGLFRAEVVCESNPGNEREAIGSEFGRTNEPEIGGEPFAEEPQPE